MNQPTTDIPAPGEEVRKRAMQAAGLFRLPLRRQTWVGQVGGHWGRGTGNSLDFHDHRPYQPGDDIRGINWQAYARTGHYSMKLFREEVTPKVDLVLDVSESMWLYPEKQERAWELFFLALESGLRDNASIRPWLWVPGGYAGVETSAVRASGWSPGESRWVKGGFAGIPLRRDALRIVISDQLFPQPTAEILPHLAGERGAGMIWMPYDREESEPTWDGNLELEDCETGESELSLVDEHWKGELQAAYHQHFLLIEAEGQRRQVLTLRIPAQGELNTILRKVALGKGALEVWH